MKTSGTWAKLFADGGEMLSREGIVTGDSGEGRTPKCQAAALEGWVTVECQGEGQFWYEEWSFAGSGRACGWICLTVSWPGATAGPGASQDTSSVHFRPLPLLRGLHPEWVCLTSEWGRQAGVKGSSSYSSAVLPLLLGFPSWSFAPRWLE